jgi:Sortase domain
VPKHVRVVAVTHSESRSVGPRANPGISRTVQVNRRIAAYWARVSHRRVKVAATLAAVVGVFLVVDALDAPASSPMSTAPLSLAATSSVPIRIRIPAINVDAPLTALAVSHRRHLSAALERNRNLAAWYQNGVVPGAVGPAIIAGYVDNWRGTAVFHDLDSLHAGDTIDVDRADGTTAEFAADAVDSYDGRRFPEGAVFGHVDRPELRVVAYGAGFDKRQQEHRGTVVVFAHLVAGQVPASSTPAPRPSAAAPALPQSAVTPVLRPPLVTPAPRPPAAAHPRAATSASPPRGPRATP